MKGKIRKIACAALSLTLAASITASSVMAFAKSGVSPADFTSVQALNAEELTGKVDMSALARENFAANVEDNGEESVKTLNTTKTVIVSLDVPSITDRIDESTSVLDYLSTAEGRRAAEEIASSQNKFLSSLSSAGIAYKLTDRYSKVMNGVAIEVNTAHAKKIQRMAGVTATGLSKMYATMEVDVQTNYSNVHGTGIYDSSDYLDEFDGSGVTVAILDTGLDYTHDAFQTLPETENVNFTKEKIAAAVAVTGEGSLASKNLTAARGGNLTVDDVYISKKVPFAYDYADKDADVYPSYSQHGTHVAGIIAGQDDTYIDKDGNEVGGKDDGKNDFLGVAPSAQLVICKVFTDDLSSPDLGGATSEDIVAALDDCVTLGVDIVNMSLGTASGFSMGDSFANDSEGQQLQRVYSSMKARGISLITAAGNEYSSGYGSDYGTNLITNPDAGTVGSPSTFVGAVSVASVNGQTAPYMVSNPEESGTYGSSPIYYNEANDSNSVPFDFAEEMLGSGETQKTFKYYVIPGTGQAGDYSQTVRNNLTPVSEGGLKPDGEKRIVVVRRGNIDFKTKVETAHRMGADGIIIYNNVPGDIRMTLGEIVEEDRIPAVSVNMSAGSALTANPQNPSRLRSEGTIEINTANQAGPFMNDYSSWGATPDLKLKPDITSHGGEITSTVAGGYEEMSGTSMATPNLAGFMALVKDYLRGENAGMSATELTRRTNQIVMSTATLLFDEDKLPYSPRKQGSGLATLANVFNTKAYLSTDESNGGAEDDRPKIELGEDEAKTGIYDFSFKLTNFGSSDLSFTLIPRFMTETIAAGGIAVAESAYMLDDNPAVFTLNGGASDGNVTIGANQTITIGVRLTLSAAEKAYLARFENGMYVEGFISLQSKTDGQCDLNLPFMGFYGDWEAAPMLDYDAYEIAEIEKDTSLEDDEKPSECVFATQLYSTYYNERYAVPMGGFAYVQDEDADQIYVEEDHCAVSRFNEYNGPSATDSYLTTTGIRSLYAGLLRNAELVTYNLYNADTGELVTSGEKYRVGKAYAGGGSSRPALVDLKLSTEELGLVNNGKYRMEFSFYMYAKDRDDPEKQNPENTFTSDFYVDYDAPMLVGSRIRYYNYNENNRVKQRIYLDLDIYDNHYPQSVLLGYDPNRKGIKEVEEIKMATEYVTPVYNAKKNGTTTVSIEITDIYEKWGDDLYVQIDDYALNHRVYGIDFDVASKANQDGRIAFNDPRITVESNGRGTLTLSPNEAYRPTFTCGTANSANYTWTSDAPDVVAVKNGELFAIKAGDYANVTIGSTAGGTLNLRVNVSDDTPKNLSLYSLSFTPIEDNHESLHVAAGTVSVNAGQTFDISVLPDPWYYPIGDYDFKWTSSNEDIATVEKDSDDPSKAMVTTKNKRGTAVIQAVMVDPETEREMIYSAVVTLSVQEPYVISNMSLSRYYGSEETVILPDDKNIMYIGEEAFKDNTTMKTIVIPKTVTEINERAFLDCTALENVYFIDITEDGAEPVKDLAALNIIYATAFEGCTNLKRLDLTNVKVITVGEMAFRNCANLEKIVHMEKIGIADEYAFAGCVKLEDADISGLHTAAANVFAGCTGLQNVTTGKYTMISEGMFNGCTSLENITINNSRVGGSLEATAYYYWRDENGDQIWERVPYGGGAFEGCSNLQSVTFGSVGTDIVFRIDPYAFSDCAKLSSVTFNGSVSYIGDRAFRGCTSLTSFTMPEGNPTLGNNVFDSATNITWSGYTTESNNAVYYGNTLVKAPATISGEFTLKSGATVIGPYAFSGTTFDSGASLNLTGVTELGEGAFYGIRGLTTVNLPSTLTAIPDYAFANANITTITIPKEITYIGAHAFDGALLQEVTFDSPSGLKEIGSYAFANTKISQIVLPAGAETMGEGVLHSCANLNTATLPAVKSIGGYTLTGCTSLTKVTFADGATVTGEYTFYPGASLGGTLQSRLTTVNLPDTITSIGMAAFRNCNALTSINLNKVTEVGEAAFLDCTSLASVTNIEKLTAIGERAFGNTAITNINIPAAVDIGGMAFAKEDGHGARATSLTLGAAQNIGAYAFAGNNLNSVAIPAGLKTLGEGAFLENTSLSTITAADGGDFFTDGNVLYRKIDGVSGESYELCHYPAGKRTATYTVIDGTSAIQAYALAYLPAGAVGTVNLPYTLKNIGDGAFYQSAISRYNFNSIAAPTLLTEYRELPTVGSEDFSQLRSLYFRNFNDDFIFHAAGVLQTPKPSTITIGYPSNGTGYDNYIFSNYFGTTVDLGELPEDDTRNLIAIIDAFMSAEKVAEWTSAEVSDALRQEILQFSDSVKNAHRMLNNLMGKEKQLEYLNEGVDREAKLYAIEAALKPVKTKFNIPVSISRLSVDPSSTYKKDYKTGEKFVIDGLAILVTYDDYSTEVIVDTSLMTIDEDYAGELDTNYSYVTINYGGRIVRVPITVSDITDGPEEEPAPETPEEGGETQGQNCNNMGLWIGLGVGIPLVLIVAAVVIFGVIRRKKANKKSDGAQEEASEPQKEDDFKETSAKEQTSENNDTAEKGNEVEED